MDIAFTLYLAAPAFAANMAPVVAARWRLLERLNRPLDAGRSWRGRRLFGEHKTLRGMLAGIAAGAVVAAIQHFLPLAISVPYATLPQALLFGALAGCGALVGDAAESCIKRQLGIASGRPFIPFDFIDYIVGFMIFTLPLYRWHGTEVVILTLFALIVTPLVNIVSHLVHIKSRAW